MEGLADIEVSSSPLLDCGELASGSPRQWQRRSRRAASPRFDRRLAAIVVADVVGYSRLMGRDEEGAFCRLRELQAAIAPIVEARGGRIANTAGDAMLFEFSSSVAALDGALAIQEVVGVLNRGTCVDDQMLLRIGVNIGDVIVEGGDVFGEVVNVASRLEAIAEPGGICVSHSCYTQTKRHFAIAFADLGEQRLKNIAEPVHAYAVRPIDERADARNVASADVLPWPEGCAGRRSRRPDVERQCLPHGRREVEAPRQEQARRSVDAG
jgi:class 3 adenylate cyclase